MTVLAVMAVSVVTATLNSTPLFRHPEKNSTNTHSRTFEGVAGLSRVFPGTFPQTPKKTLAETSCEFGP